jgi:uncharacterized membrane protein
MVQNYISDTSVSDTFKKGWRLTIDNFWMLLVVILIAGAIGSIGQMFIRGILAAGSILTFALQFGNVQSAGVGILFAVIAGLFSLALAFFVTGPIQFGVAWTYLRAARKEKFELGHMFAAFRKRYLSVVGAQVLLFLAIVGGLILFVIPGIIIAIRLSFTPYIIMDEKISARDALRKSWELTKGQGWKIVGIILLSMLLSLAGLLAFIIGIIFVAVWVASTSAVFYASVTKKPRLKVAA